MAQIDNPKTQNTLKTKKKARNKTNGLSFLKTVIILLVIVLAATLIGFKPKWGLNLFFWKNGENLSTREIEKGIENNNPIVIPPSVQAEEDVVVQVVEKSSPAVVSIIISKDIPKFEQYYFDPFNDQDFFGGSPFEQFFGQKPDSQEGSSQKIEIGGGTGFVVSSNGLIVTNKHVVDDSSAEYTVITSDGRKYDAKVLGRARANDVAVLKINPESPKEGKGVNKMETLTLGDSSQVKIGQTVIAIGNALGEFRNSVSKGIISGLSRNITAGGLSGTEELDQLIQTDAAINQGNSGGPLFNLRGEVIGINVAMAAGAQNIGFAIPINTVKNIISSVEKTGKIVQPYLGVRYLLINEVIKERNNLPVGYGALVARGQEVGDLAVMPGSPADKAGIVENDIILEINGTKIDESSSLAKIISGLEVGKEIELKLWHQGETKTIKVKLEETPQR